MELGQFIEALSGLSLDGTIDVVGWAIADVDYVKVQFGLLEQLQQNNGTITCVSSLHNALAISKIRFLSPCLSVLPSHYTGILSAKLNMSYTTSHRLFHLISAHSQIPHTCPEAQTSSAHLQTSIPACAHASQWMLMLSLWFQSGRCESCRVLEWLWLWFRQ